MNPRYLHWCNNCLFLDQHEEFDLYYCEQHKNTGENECQSLPHIVVHAGGTVWSLNKNEWSYLGDTENHLPEDIRKQREAKRQALRICSQVGLIDKIDVDCVLAGVSIT